MRVVQSEQLIPRMRVHPPPSFMPYLAHAEHRERHVDGAAQPELSNQVWQSTHMLDVRMRDQHRTQTRDDTATNHKSACETNTRSALPLCPTHNGTALLHVLSQWLQEGRLKPVVPTTIQQNAYLVRTLQVIRVVIIPC